MGRIDYIEHDGHTYATIQTYANQNKVTRQTVYRWAKEGKIVFLRLLNRNLIKIN